MTSHDKLPLRAVQLRQRPANAAAMLWLVAGKFVSSLCAHIDACISSQIWKRFTDALSLTVHTLNACSRHRLAESPRHPRPSTGGAGRSHLARGEGGRVEASTLPLRPWSSPFRRRGTLPPGGPAFPFCTRAPPPLTPSSRESLTPSSLSRATHAV